MPNITLNHFEASLLFALFASVVLGVVTRQNDKDRLRYGLTCFGYFVLALFAIGWVMRLGHG